MLWLAELQSLMPVQRHFRMQYVCQPPIRKRILFWDNKLRSTGSLLSVKFPGKTRTSEENVNRIRQAVKRRPRKSIHAASLQLRTNSKFNSAQCPTQKAPPKGIQDSNDPCTKTK
jgi:hypothetical protein